MKSPLDTESIRSLLVPVTTGEWLAADPDFPDVPRVINRWHYTIAEVTGHGWDEPTERGHAAIIAAAPSLLVALCDELDELRATLANERGEGEPPALGWAWLDTCWVRDLPADEQLRVSWDATELDTERPTWRCWRENAEDWGGDFIVTGAPTARDAMRQADAMIAADKTRSPA